ncbi:GNAT family N-acetyltransferase [Aquicoccus sp. G2-2]|uniref:GNAT family N-acetyltransferase n=1 Tax=Aquicoccus sp. G2-2 TaxID=3092120 RepID=UPI002ADFA884|nr:GNAT family N-acetyltransferase [Aquicoccus sp. G2-2]MEA1112808.1 GNAT family N-acetyltransferase [Aquicoccus sp. G2-2]
MLTLRQPATAEDHAAIRALCRAYRDQLTERASECPQIVENYYDQSSYEALLKRLPALHARPDGALFLALIDGTPVGCGMTHRIDAATCEIKRVFVSPEARGHGAATAIFDAAITQAKADGYRLMVLDTMIWLREAIALYAKLGFDDAAPFYVPAPEFAPYIRFFARAL